MIIYNIKSEQTDEIIASYNISAYAEIVKEILEDKTSLKFSVDSQIVRNYCKDIYQFMDRANDEANDIIRQQNFEVE